MWYALVSPTETQHWRVLLVTKITLTKSINDSNRGPVTAGVLRGERGRFQVSWLSGRVL